MRLAPWKALTRALQSSDESLYLDRLRQRLPVEESQQLLEQEIVQEIAGALGRSEAKLLAALERLAAAGREVDDARDALDQLHAIDRWNARRTEALRARHELQIHREAAGMRRNPDLTQLYPIPGPRR